jgi:predicted nuclease of restriction endonuclease-like (RecB) superfamily
MPVKNRKKSDSAAITVSRGLEKQFERVAGIIRNGIASAHKTVNGVVVATYWRVGEFIHARVNGSGWGESVVEELASYLLRTLPNPRGFSQRNLWRMKQFYEAYRGDKKLSTLLTELPWSAHLHILSKAKTPGERDFYLRLSIQENYDVRAVERAMGSGMFDLVAFEPSK